MCPDEFSFGFISTSSFLFWSNIHEDEVGICVLKLDEVFEKHFLVSDEGFTSGFVRCFLFTKVYLNFLSLSLFRFPSVTW